MKTYNKLSVACTTRMVGCVFIYLIAVFALGGCAALPNAVQPRTEGSQGAEGAWQILDTVDTLQTVQIARHPLCYREADPLARLVYGGAHPGAARVVVSNLVLMGAHAYVSTWLDDRVADEDARHPDADLDDSGWRPWYVARIVWHATSLIATTGSVANNFSRGLTPTHASCADEIGKP